jgi:hypothetical protein
MLGLSESFLHFDLLVFGLSFLASELVSKKLYPCFLLIKRKKIRIHHTYVGAILAFFSALTGQVALFNIGLGTMANDIVSHVRKKISKFFKKSK